MTPLGWLQCVVYFGLILLLTRPMGAYMAGVFAGERVFLPPVLRRGGRAFYRLFGIREDEDQSWGQYALALLAFSVVGGLVTYGLLRLQGLLPLNPQHYGAAQMPADLAFNTAMSF